MTEQRFYDIEPSLGKAVRLLLLFPAEMQSIMANGVSRIAEQEFKAKQLIQDLKSLGSDKVMALHKSKQKKRSYDQNREVHETLNYLMILSQENRYRISLRMIELSTHMQQYLQLCRMYSILPPREIISTLTETYVNDGHEKAKHYLQAVETQLKFHSQRKTAEPVFSEAILDHRAGLKITDH